MNVRREREQSKARELSQEYIVLDSPHIQLTFEQRGSRRHWLNVHWVRSSSDLDSIRHCICTPPYSVPSEAPPTAVGFALAQLLLQIPGNRNGKRASDLGFPTEVGLQKLGLLATALSRVFSIHGWSTLWLSSPSSPNWIVFIGYHPVLVSVCFSSFTERCRWDRHTKGLLCCSTRKDHERCRVSETSERSKTEGAKLVYRYLEARNAYCWIFPQPQKANTQNSRHSREETSPSFLRGRPREQFTPIALVALYFGGVVSKRIILSSQDTRYLKVRNYSRDGTAGSPKRFN